MTGVRYIDSEAPEHSLWEELSFWQNEMIARSFLKDRYHSLGFPKPEYLALQNAQSFVYYLKQAHVFFRSQGTEFPIHIAPLLLYYGQMNLLKAWVLTFSPDYPASTSVLQHGLSSRKKKRVQFRWIEDEVRIQKEGLFPFLLQKFPVVQIVYGNRFLIKDLLSIIPDFMEKIQSYTNSFPTSLYPVKIGNPSEKGLPILLPEKILDTLHLTTSAFMYRLNKVSEDGQFILYGENTHAKELILHWISNEKTNPNETEDRGFHHPWFYENKKGDYYLWIGKHHLFQPVPQLLAQYMLMFSLSMLSRYDAPLWGEITDGYSSDDHIYIEQLLPTIRRIFPNHILNLIRGDKTIFRLR